MTRFPGVLSALGALAAAGIGCSNQAGTESESEAECTLSACALDLLVVIDNSAGMGEEQVCT